MKKFTQSRFPFTGVGGFVFFAICLQFAWTDYASCSEDARLKWFGHAAFQYTTRSGKVLLIDPWLTNPKAPASALKDVQAKKIDAVLVTHAHQDHVGEAFALAKKFNAPLVASYELTEIAKKNGVGAVQPLNPSGSATVAGVTITAVQAVHSSGYKDGSYGGAPLGFVISEPDSAVIYHAGDTGVFSDMAQIADLYHPDVALIPIGGIYTMKPVEGALSARLLRSKVIVPMHFGTFPALVGTPGELKSEMERSQAPGKMVELKTGADTLVKSLF